MTLQTRQHFSKCLLSNVGEPVCIVSSVFLDDRSGTWCGLLLLEPSCLKIHRVAALLQTVAVTSGCLSCCCLPISFKLPILI